MLWPVAVLLPACSGPAQSHKAALAMTCDTNPDETLRYQAVDSRGVVVVPRGHGMTSICLDVCAEHAEGLIQGLDPFAVGGDCPDLARRRPGLWISAAPPPWPGS